MMRSSCLAVAVLFIAAKCSADDSGKLEKGDVVVVKADAPLKRSGKVVGQVKAGDVVKVNEVRGAWVEVGEKPAGYVRADNLIVQSQAIGHVNNLLGEKPNDPDLLVARARMRIGMDELPPAERDLEAALEKNPEHAEAHFQLSVLKRRYERPDEALEELNKAIELDGKRWQYYRARGELRLQRKEKDAAIADFEKVVDLEGADAETYNNLAWWYATSNDPDLRNGQKAVDYATKACELTHYKNYVYVDTLAAAYAEANDFTNAVKWQEKALELCNDAEQRPGVEERLKKYRLNQPHREDAQ